MRKVMLMVVIMFMAFFIFKQDVKAQDHASVSIGLSMAVSPYIETMPTPGVLFLGSTTHVGTAEYLDGSFRGWNVAYANCPFALTLTGSNAAGQTVPRFARAEVGANSGGKYDILNTFYQIHFITNGVEVNTNTPDVWGTGASQFPVTKTFAEAPHNGQVYLSIIPYINSDGKQDVWSQRKTLINPDFSHEQSADAGTYACEMTVTLTASM